MKYSIPFLLAVLLFSSLTGCGSKGPLVLPGQKSAQNSASAQNTSK
jgi:predicted small lipoprotein YifL